MDHRCYSITINNQYGSKQSYSLFAEAPQVKCQPALKRICTNIITNIHGVPSGSGQAIFTMTKQLFAICGTYEVDDSATAASNGGSGVEAGISAEIVDKRPVAVGHQDSSGNLISGSQWDVIVTEDSPAFDTNPHPKPAGDQDCFAIKTGQDFTAQEAHDGKFILGIGGSIKRAVGPYATFAPMPNTLYQINPGEVFYVTVGHYEARALIKPELKDAEVTCRVDFEALGTDDVQIVHDTHGKLQVITQPN